MTLAFEAYSLKADHDHGQQKSLHSYCWEIVLKPKPIYSILRCDTISETPNRLQVQVLHASALAQTATVEALQEARNIDCNNIMRK